jgi:hypothetical protein
MNALLTVAFFAAVSAAPYNGPKTVYILPMAGGLDQYVAQCLTRDHVMQVVTDPKTAEVVMTDRLGDGFEQRLEQIRPNTNSDKKAAETPLHVFHSSREQGTVFLVDPKTRQVVWSDYHKPPRSNSDHDLNRTAEEIARQLSGK